MLAAAGVLAAGVAGCSSGSSAQGSGSGGDSSAPHGAMLLSTTTSTQDTGLLDVLVPAFERTSACTVKTVAVGSGEALTMGERGNADVLLVHSPAAEQSYMSQGHGLSRKPVMYNDFVVVGPPSDPAHIAGAPSASAALSRIARAEQPFASRADDSGTNAEELSLWDQAGIKPHGSWYLQTGQGMGDTLTIANQKQAYTLTDRGTFLATKGLDSKIEFQGTPDLRNYYHVIVVKHAGTNVACARDFAHWIRDAETQRMIGHFGLAKFGQHLFVPDAGS